jgi:hypothetical protein
VQDIKDIVDHESNELIFNKLEAYLNDAKKIIAEQCQVKNYHWAKSVVKNFSGIKKLVDDIKSYSRRITLPHVWKDHNENTMFLK